jgi:hypothetical protein
MRNRCISEANSNPLNSGGSSRCGLIQNSDQRNFCMARAQKSTARCGLITNADIRNHCYAVVAHSSSKCGLIKNADMRNMCYSETR